MAKKLAWFVRLGPLEWARYTYDRLDDDPLRLLGSVKRGPQMGALAITADGQYVQVVGDFITPLCTSQIVRALVKAKAPEPRAPARPLCVPVVVVKRRRVFVAP